MIIVLDTSVIIHTLLHPEVEKDLDLIAQSDTYAPDLVVAELGNVLGKYVRFKDLDIDMAKDKFQSGLDLISQIIPSDLLAITTFDLSFKHRISFYDSLYLALAIELKCPLWTLDKKLHLIAAEYKLNFISPDSRIEK